MHLTSFFESSSAIAKDNFKTSFSLITEKPSNNLSPINPFLNFLSQLSQRIHFFKSVFIQHLMLRLLQIARSLTIKSGLKVVPTFDLAVQTTIATALKNHNFFNDLAKAVTRNELSLHYQPQINLKTGQLLGVESLVRWDHPSLGRISPADFIPIAEASGLIVPLGYWILKQACQQYQHWQSLLMEPFKLSVNLSPHQLRDPNFLLNVKTILRETQIDPSCLELEITESFMHADLPQAIATLKELRQLGLKIALDDFGTGFSSFSWLKHLPIQTLKIDKSFLENLLIAKNQIILKSIIELGHCLKLKIVAEGIENQEQLQILTEMNCDYGQGYFFSRPLHLEAIADYLQRVKLGIHLPQFTFA